MSNDLEQNRNTSIPVERKPIPAQEEQDHIFWVIDAYFNGAICATDATHILKSCKL